MTATQRAVLPFTITCTVALTSSGAMAGSGESASAESRRQFAAWRTHHTMCETSLDKAEHADPIGVYRCWRADVSRRKGFRTAAIGAAGAGDFTLARKALARARKTTRDDAPGARPLIGWVDVNAARQAYDRALRLAGRFARDGRPDLSQEAADFAAEIAIEHQLGARASRHERRSAAILRAAKTNLVSNLLAISHMYLRHNDPTSGAVALAAASEVRIPWSRAQKRQARALAKRITEWGEKGALIKSRPWESPDAERGFFGSAFSSSFSSVPSTGFAGAGASY